MEYDLSQGPITLSVTPVPGPQGAPGPAGLGSPVPGGRLSLVSGQPEMPPTSDYTSAALYYVPFESDQIPLFGGTSWSGRTFTSGPLDTVGLSMSGGSAWSANTKRDVFVTLINDVPTLCTGPAWPSDDVSARGLVRRNGLWVNANTISVDLTSTSSATVPANQATWVGSINIGATAGMLSATFTLGQNRRCDVWNVYHQREVLLGVGCPPVAPATIVAWKPTSQYPTFLPFNNDINNSGYYFTGLPQNVKCLYLQRGFVDSLNYSYCSFSAAVCKNTIDNVKGTIVSFNSDTTTDACGVSGNAVFEDRGSIGSHRAIMGTANAHNTNGITMWGLRNATNQEDAHVMWISYQG